MKKKRSIIILSAIMAFLVVGVVSLFLLMNREETTQTGNKADIDWYTEDGKEFVITTVDELYGLVKLSQYYNFSGQTIKLGADIVVNEGNAEDWAKKAPKKKWFPIDGFAGKFDGQGHTISGIYGYGADTVAGLFSNTKTKANIRDFKLINSYFKVDGLSPVGSIVSNGCGTVEKVYSNAIITSNGENVGGIVGKANDDGTASAMAKTMKIINCWFDGSITLTTKTGRYGGGIVGLVSGGTLTVSHCLNSGDISSQSTESNGLYVGGLFGALAYANYSGAVILEDSLNVGKVETLKTTKTGSIAGSKASDVTWKITDTYTTEKSNASICTSQSGTTEGGVPQMNTDFVKGTEWYRWTTLDFDTYWAVTKDSTPVLKCFAEHAVDTSGLTKAYNLNWYVEGMLEQVIRTKEDLYGFALLSYSKTFEGQNIVLGNDIVVNEGKASDWSKGKNTPTDCWIPIGRSLAFQGNFDGKGYTVSGLYGKTTVSFMGLFGWAGNYSEIKNVSVKNSYFESVEASSGAVGSIAGRLEGKIDTAYSDSIISGTGALLGGIAGYKRTNVESKITNCWYDGTINMVGDKGKYVGGIIGRLIDGTLEIDNCLFSGKINIGGKRRTVSVGGFIGVISAGNVVVNGCLNSGEFEVTEAEKVNAVGRVFGQLADSEAINITVTSSYFTNVGYNGDYYYYRQGDKQTIKGGAELKEIKNISGQNGYRTTELDFSKYWAIVVNEDGTPILKSFAKKVPSVAGLTKTFDKSWYNPDKDTYILKDRQDLYGFSYLSNSKIDFKGKKVVLANDIQVHGGSAVDWSNNTNTPGEIYNWDGIGKYTAFLGTFDGQGHTISGLYGVTDTVNMGLFASVGTDGIVQNLRLTNTYFGSTKTGSAAVGSIAGRCEGSVHGVYSDAILTSIGNNNGGIVGYKNGDTESKITNCWFAGSITMGGDTTNATGGIVGRHYAGPLEISNCLFSGELAVAGIKRSSNTGGFVGRAEGNLTIDGCLNSGILKVVDVAKMDSMGRVIGQIKNDEATSVVMKNTYFTMEGYNPTNYWYCAGDKPAIERGAELKSKESIMGYGGYQTTSLDFDKYWTVVVNENGTPILKSFTDNVPSVAGLEKTFDKSWYNPEENTYVIDDKKDLYGFAYLSNSKIDFKGKTIVLANDILKVNTGTASEWSNGTNIPDIIYNWDGIGKYTSFEGCFDGQGHTISGLYGITDTTHVGLFASVATKGVIKNVSLKDTYFENKATGSAGVGSIAGRCEGSVHSAYSDAILKSSGNNNGGIVGYKNEATKSSITNCWYAGTMKVTGNASGGIVGRHYAGTLNMSDCLFSGTLSVGGEKRSVSTGGLVGRVADKLTLDGCLNSGILEVAEASKMDSLGRVIGQITNDKSTDVAMKHTYFTNKGDNATTYWYCAGKLPTIEYGAELKDEKTIMGYGGFDTTSLDFENAWVVVLDDEATPNINEAGTPVLKKFAQKAPSVAGRQKIFDKSWYDAKKDKYYIENKEDLYGLAYLSNSKIDFEGKTIVLKNDILYVNEGFALDWSKGTDIPDDIYNWDGVGKYTPFYGEFDGQGHTIGGLYGVTNTAHIGLFASVDERGSVHNLRLTNSYFEITKTGSAGIGSIAGLCEGDVYDIYSDAILKSNGNNNGGIIGYKNENTESKITNCWYTGTLNVNSNASGGIIGRIYAGDVNLDTCLFSGKISINGDNRSAIGGFVGRVDQSVTIKNSLNSGEFELIETETADSTGRIIGLVNNTKSVSMTLENVYFTDKGFNGTENWYCAGKLPTITSDYHSVAEEKVKGQLACFNTNLNFIDDWVIVLDDEATADIDEAGTPILKKFADATTTTPQTPENVDISWYSYKEDTYTLSDAEDLRGFSYLSSIGLTFAGKTIKLEDDIELNKGKGSVSEWVDNDFAGLEEWTPIGTEDSAFAGVFDGQMHTISGLYTNGSSYRVGMFGYTAPGSVVKKFLLTDSYIYADGETISNNLYAHLGSVVGECCGTVDTVYSNAIVKTPGRRAGGVVGVLNTTDKSKLATVTNCWYDGKLNIIDSGIYAGGIVGVAFKNEMNISNCLFTGTINMEATEVELRLGGIVGSENNAKSIVNISDCVSSGSIYVKSDNAVGSLIGKINKADSKYNISACYGTEECYDKTIGSINGTNPTNIGSKISKDLISGAKGYQLTLLDLDYWVARTDDVPGLKSFVPSAQLADITDVIRGDISWYDKSATYYIDNAKELIGFMILSLSGENFQDEMIYLTDDISLNEVAEDTIAKWEAGTQVPKNEWIPIGSGEDGTHFEGVFDGQMHTISGVYVNSDDCYVGLFGGIEYYSVIKNLYLTDSYFYTSGNTLSADSTDTYAYLGSVVGLCKGTIDTVYSDAVVKTSGYRIGGITGALNTTKTAKNAGFNATVNNCWFAGKVKMEASSKYGGGIVGVAVNNDMNITRCMFDGTITSESETSNLSIGGIISQNHSSSAVLDIQDCVVAGEIKALNDTRVGALIGYNNKGEYRIANTYAVEDVYLYEEEGTQFGTTIGVANDGSGTVTSNGILLKKSELQGTDAYVNTLLDFEDSWYALTGNTPVLKVFANKIENLDLIISDFTGFEQNNWYGDAVTIYNIHSLSAFKAFRDYVNDGIHFASKTIHLCTDLDLNSGWTAPSSATDAVSGNPVAWTPIGSEEAKAFRGTFEGHGYQISGLYMEQAGYVGLFGYVLYNGVVRDFGITNSYLETTGSNNFTGSAVALIYKGKAAPGDTEYKGGEVSGIYSDAIIVSGGRQTGGIVGRAEATVAECWFAGEIYTTRSSYPIEAGGIVGSSNKSDDLIIKNCLYSGKLINTGSVASSTNSGIGGIYGGTFNSTPSIQISNCVCSGTIEADEDLVIGTLAGVIRHASVDCDISNCYAREDIITDKTISDAASFLGAVTVTNATGDVSDSVVTALTNMKGVDVYGEGGMNLDFDNTWIARREDVPVPRCFVGNVVENSATKEKDDGVLRLLMIGNSFCYYFVEELYGMAEAAGIKMEVCNVYSSGCPLKDHWTWYENKEAKYQFFTTNADGRSGVSGVSLEYCLAAQDWDVISLQTGSTQKLAINDGINTLKEDSEPYLGKLYSLLKERFPDARLMWHHRWEYEIGFDRSNPELVPDRANQTARYEISKAFSEWVCNEYDVEMVPTGDAWQAARGDEKILDTLCGRIKTGNLVQGDYYHDGDVGGGQYLNACVWFETLTGVSCLDNTYVPDYELSADKMTLLKGYAHDAVSNIYPVAE